MTSEASHASEATYEASTDEDEPTVIAETSESEPGDSDRPDETAEEPMEVGPSEPTASGPPTRPLPVAEARSWCGLWPAKLATDLLIRPPQPNSRYQTVMVGWPAPTRSGWWPHPSVWGPDLWDSTEHVHMPCSPQSQFAVATEKGPKHKELRSRWALIEKALKSPMRSAEDLENAISTYNNARQLDFAGLHEYLEGELEPEGTENVAFFERILPGMVQLCLNLPTLVTQSIPLLKKRHCESLTFSQGQIATLLANAFFCTFPKRIKPKGDYLNYPGINFHRLFSDLNNPNQMQKFRCLINYFRRMIARPPEEEHLVSYERQCVPFRDLPVWSQSKTRLKDLHINAQGTIEDDGFGMLQVDFANAFIGGGVLGHGCVQEEIRFLISPELILARLFTERLSSNECLVITGFERFSNYKGYASSFQFDGSHKDSTPIDSKTRHRKTTMVAIDALPPGQAKDQYKQENICRDLNKAFVGFKNYNASTKNPVAIATGNWGCGAFGGDPQLKSLIQLLAAAEAGRDMAYFTFDNRELRDQIYATHQLLRSHELSVGQIFDILCKYSKRKEKLTLFEFIDNFVSTYDLDTDEEMEVGNGEVKGKDKNKKPPKPVPSEEAKETLPPEISEAVTTPRPGNGVRDISAVADVDENQRSIQKRSFEVNPDEEQTQPYCRLENPPKKRPEKAQPKITDSFPPLPKIVSNQKKDTQ
eukprot:maker-scaffold128_size327099-snap-gene-1.11 protein:Tk06463 transcript:maker-scaffold128_size327099-snap-gene-1.11-mRNA-1 annotation:"poly(adp-ribose) glycohydrolase-like isoform x1"